MAIAALVLGILSLVLSVASFWIFIGYLSIPALLLGIVGIILSAISMKKVHKGTGGLVMPILATVFSLIPAIIWILSLSFLASLGTLV